MNGWKVFGISFLALIMLVVMWFAGQAMFFANRVVTTSHQITNQTLNGTNVLYNYDWFYGEYHDYLAIQQKITQGQQALTQYEATLPKNTSEWTWEEQGQVSQDQSVVQGLQYQEDDIVAGYNAHAQQASVTEQQQANFDKTQPAPKLSYSLQRQTQTQNSTR